ncbi:MAG: CoA pyrophosphatase [Rhizobiaceae bacterium]
MTLDYLTPDIYSVEAFEARVLERFASRADVLEATGGDQVLNPNHPMMVEERTFKPAAVLIPVIDRQGESTILLTQRTERLSSHSGQIALPGGKIDADETPVQAALREAHEEVGLAPELVDVLGTFGPYYSGSGYRVSPVVGMVRGEPELTINPDEVAAVFEVPLAFLMDQKNHNRESRFWNDKEIFYYTMPYAEEGSDPPVEWRIWGLTAGIIRMVQERLYGIA